MQKNLTLQNISIGLLNEIKKSFLEFAGSFRLSDDPEYNSHMKLKQIHTANVVKEIRGLGQALKMAENEIAFIEVIAWLHDIGRFEQFHKYSTFSDAESENHAEIGLRIIEEQKLLKDFKSDQVSCIYNSILNHNIPQVPADQSPELDFYSRILRDADKLDIWRVVIGTNIFHRIKKEKMPEIYTVQYELLDYFENSKTIPLDIVHSFYDSILFRLSWIYNLNFEYTLGEFKKRKLAQQLLAKMPSSTRLDKIEKLVSAYTLLKESYLK